MILEFKELFADGTPTRFYQKILAGVYDENLIKEPCKIHKICEGQRWRPGMSIEMAFGVRTKKYKQFNKNIKPLSVCVSTQNIVMDYHLERDILQVYVDGRKMQSGDIVRLIQNEGLIRPQFIDWHFSDHTSFSGQIIHWTNYKY